MKNACSTTSGGKKSCCGTMIKGALIGGFIMFLCFSASWMLLPFHKSTINTFKNDAAVTKVMQANAAVSGIYMLPHMAPKADAVADDAKKSVKAKTAAADKTTVAPVAFISYKAEGFDMKDMKKQMLTQLVLCFIAAGFLTCLLKATCCGCPVGLSLKTGLLVGLMGYLPNWIWFHFPTKATLLDIADVTVAFTLAGFVLSKTILCSKSNSGSCGPVKGSCGGM